jgi:allene oxide cyclase
VNGEGKDAAGNTLVFANPIYDWTNKTLLGSDSGACFRTEVGRTWECRWTLFLNGNQITVEGPFYDTFNSMFAITGGIYICVQQFTMNILGTGSFVGIYGEMRLVHLNPEGTLFGFEYNYNLLP